jgi:hypothetical protein
MGGEHVQHSEFERRQLDASASDIDAAVAVVEERLIAPAKLGRGDAVEPSVDGVRPEVERGEMKLFAADLDGFVEGTEAERPQRVAAATSPTTIRTGMLDRQPTDSVSQRDTPPAPPSRTAPRRDHRHASR